MKLAVISQQALDPTYIEIGDLQNKYCISKFVEKGIPAYRHIGTLDTQGNVIPSFTNNFIDEYYYYDKETNLLYLRCKDFLEPDTGLDPRGYKTYYAFKYLIENVDFDILFTTNCTSYLDVEGIIRIANTFNTPRLYTGAMSGWEEINLWFCVSAYAFISRDLVEKIVEHKEQYLHCTTKESYYRNAFVYEDVCIGTIFRDLGLNLRYQDQPHFPRPPKIHSNITPVDRITKCTDCVTYRVGKDYIEGFKKIHSFYS